MKPRLLGLLAPYLAVLIFWCGFESAWASLLAYHALILILSRRHLGRVAVGWRRRHLLLALLPSLATGPLVYSLLPSMVQLPIDAWLSAYGLSGLSRILMIPYFGVVHPVFEQAHWSSLRVYRAAGAGAPAPGVQVRAHELVAHVAFAGYHVLVLASLMRPEWVVISFGVLVLASVAWRRLEQYAGGGLAVAACSHILVDSGLVLAAVLRAA